MFKHLPKDIAGYCELNKEYLIKIDELDLGSKLGSDDLKECKLIISLDEEGVSFKLFDTKTNHHFMQFAFTDKLWSCTGFFDEEGRDYVDLSESPLFGKQPHTLILEKTEKFTDLVKLLLKINHGTPRVVQPVDSYLTRLYKTVSGYLTFNLSSSRAEL